MPITRVELIAQRSPDLKVVWIKPAAYPNGSAIAVHFCSGRHTADAVSNAAAHTRIAELYELARELANIQTQDAEILALKRRARDIGAAIAKTIKTLADPQEGSKDMP